MQAVKKEFTEATSSTNGTNDCNGDSEDCHDGSSTGGSPGLLRPEKKSGKRRNPNVLIQWIEEHPTNPYPSKNEKQYLAEYAGMNLRQLNDWFANARRNMKKLGVQTWLRKRNGVQGQRMMVASTSVASPYTQYNGILPPNYVVNNHSEMGSYKMYAPYQNSTLPAAIGMANSPIASALMMPNGSNTSLTSQPYSLSRLPTLPVESCVKTEDKTASPQPPLSLSSKMLSMQPPPVFNLSTTSSWGFSRAQAFSPVMAGSGTAVTPSSPCSCLYSCYCGASPSYHLTSSAGTPETDRSYTQAPFTWPPPLGLTAAGYNYLGSSEAKEPLPANSESS